MRYWHLGTTGPEVSALILGALSFGQAGRFLVAGGNDLASSRRMIDQAIDGGVTMVDTADLYSFGQSETIIGEVLASRREAMLIATKTGIPLDSDGTDGGSSPERLRHSIDDSLRRLATDRIDLYYLHQWDGTVPVAETMSVLGEAVTAGKIRYLGISNFSGWQVVKAVQAAKEVGCPVPVVHQLYYTPEAREAEYEILPANLDSGISTMVWGALGQGLLTLSPSEDLDLRSTRRQAAGWLGPFVADEDRARTVIGRLNEIASTLGATVPQVVTAWLLERPSVSSVLLGARSAQQLTESLKQGDVALTKEQHGYLEDAAPPPPIYPFWHRALMGAGQTDPAEAAFLPRYARTMQSAPSSPAAGEN